MQFVCKYRKLLPNHEIKNTHSSLNADNCYKRNGKTGKTGTSYIYSA